jgi:hypothetical protein
LAVLKFESESRVVEAHVFHALVSAGTRVRPAAGPSTWHWTRQSNTLRPRTQSPHGLPGHQWRVCREPAISTTKLPYDWERDLIPISFVASAPYAWAAHIVIVSVQEMAILFSLFSFQETYSFARYLWHSCFQLGSLVSCQSNGCL